MNDPSDNNRMRETRATFNIAGAPGSREPPEPAKMKRKMADNPEFMRLVGSAPWLKAREKQHFRTKVFQSGNSLAVRIPVGTKLEAGMEMELTVEDGVFLSLEPVEQPKRKFNIAKVAGSAKGLNYIDPGDRSFEPRKSDSAPQTRAK
jgi:antitoxin VapB